MTSMLIEEIKSKIIEAVICRAPKFYEGETHKA